MEPAGGVTVSMPGYATERFIDKLLDNLKAVFFKNILGTMMNTIAQQTATWVVSGAKGKGPQWITNFNEFIDGYAKGMVVDAAANIIKDTTGINICTFDPTMTLNLALQVPMFPEWKANTNTNCDYKTLTNHWKDIGQKKLLNFNYSITAGSFPQTTNKMSTQVSVDETLQIFDSASLEAKRGTGYDGFGNWITCTSRSKGLTKVECEDKPTIQYALSQEAQWLTDNTSKLSGWVQKITLNAGKTDLVDLTDLEGSPFRILPETISTIKAAIKKKFEAATSEIDQNIKPYKDCQNKNREEMLQSCQDAVSQLGYKFPPAATQATGNPAPFITAWEKDVQSKMTYVVTTANSIKSGYQYLNKQVDDNLKSDLFESGAAYDSQLAHGLFNPEANQYNTYKQMWDTMSKQGMSSYLQKQTDATINQGWKAATGRIYDTFVNTPASLLNAKASNTLTKDDSAYVYTKSIVADALGIFLQTLWNGYMQKLLAALTNTKQDEETKKKLAVGIGVNQPVAEQFNKYAQKVISVEGVQSYIEKLGQPFTVNFTLQKLDLLTDFQVQLTGDAKPNIYDNVIDSKFAMAINDRMTIGEAIKPEVARIISGNKFSWGETVEPSTYNLANIKKLRKARVVPLGLELAAELARDCNFRKTYNDGSTINYAKFEDISDPPSGNGSHFGYNNQNNPYVTERLQNCFFKPFIEGRIDYIRTINENKMNEVINATIGDVVNDFDKRGSGICGDADPEESAFCNLVDPNWILKLPVTKCASVSDQGQYGELIQTMQGGERYDRCADFSSCLEEDGKGSCSPQEKYGFCVKEKNVWQFGANSCESQYNSCRTYNLNTAAGQTQVSYLKNTLSGSDICGSQNYGCNFYLNTSGPAGIWTDFTSYTKDGQKVCEDNKGIWQNGECLASRIYLNHSVQSCDVDSAGCNEFINYRDSNTNLMPDSDFEYTPANNFPENWDLLLKQEIGANKSIASKDVCDTFNTNQPGCKLGNNCGYYKTCFNYNYDNQSLCSSNKGIWYDNGICQDGTTDPTVCSDAGLNWVNCLAANKENAEQTDCVDNKGQFVEYCLSSLLLYNLCENPKLPQADCAANGGTWQEECQKNGRVITTLANQAECTAAGGAWENNECQKNGRVITTLANKADCEVNNGTWLTYCVNAKKYTSSQGDCQNWQGNWRGFGPFSDFAKVTKNGQDRMSGMSKLEIDTSALGPGYEFILLNKTILPDNGVLTKAGDVYTATAYLKANQALANPITFNLIGGLNEINSATANLNEFYNQFSSTLITSNPGTELEMRFYLPPQEGTAIVYLDSVALNLNSLNQVRSYNFVCYIDPLGNCNAYKDYDLNDRLYFKKPPADLDCHGYGPGDPPEVLVGDYTSDTCLSPSYWDSEGVFVPGKTDLCYKYAPDDPQCKNFLKVCQPAEVGCQLYTPANGDPAIPGVVSLTDYCPAECVGYQTYKQDPTIYDPEPDPLFNNFIPSTAATCSLDEVGCAQFTNLDEVAKGGEGIEYYSYLKQCIKPNLGLGEKTFFSWQGLEGRPQIIKYQFQKDSVTGAPKTIDNSGDCRLTLGENDFNCVKFFDSDNKEYNRDIRKIVSVSDDCHPYRKTDSTQKICVDTNGRWQAGSCQNATFITKDTCEPTFVWTEGSCLYDAIPSEGISCPAEANDCRSYIGNQGNDIYYQIFDTFDDNLPLDWYEGQVGIFNNNLMIANESLVLAGHSLAVPQSVTAGAIHKVTDISPGNLYTLSFWGKTSSSSSNIISVKFSTAPEGNSFAIVPSDNITIPKVKLTKDWRYFELGPVYVDWTDVANNSLIFGDLGGEGGDTTSTVYLDNINLKVVKDNIYVVKDSWTTPASCDQNFLGAEEKGAMLGCQAYTDTANQTHNLKSFTSLCRDSTVGCQLLMDTKNSLNPYSQSFNQANDSSYDDYTVPKDELMPLVLDNQKGCAEQVKGCQLMGQPVYDVNGKVSYQDIYLKNNPDQYEAIMCNEETLGCTKLINEAGGEDYFKIDPTKLCQYVTQTVLGQSVTGWFKKNNTSQGCGALPFDTATDCEKNDLFWSDKYQQCTFSLEKINDSDICQSQGGEWITPYQKEPKCLLSPFTIYQAQQANKYKGYVGECEEQYNGCSEFVDINPNFIANGGFEFVQEGALIPWTTSQFGIYNINKDFKEGNNSVQLIKTTDLNKGESNFGISQTVPRLEKGRTYKIDFYFKMPAEAKGVGDNCPLPEAAIGFNSLEPNVPKGPIYTFSAEKDWKKAEVLYTVPSDSCSDPSKLTEQECGTSYGATWTKYDDLQDFELTLYAPLSGTCSDPNYEDKTSCLTATEDWTDSANCLDSYVLYDLVEVKDNTEDKYYVIDNGTSIDRGICNRVVNWDNGCIQFLNTGEDKLETIKVNRDRNCEQWAVCSSHCSNSQYLTKSECEAIGSCSNSNPAHTSKTACESAGTCSNPTSTSKTACESAGTCSNPTSTSKTACESAGICSNTDYTSKTACESAGTCSNPAHTSKIDCSSPEIWTPETWTPETWTPETWTPYVWTNTYVWDDNICSATDLCTKEIVNEGGGTSCVSFAPKMDNVRYDLQKQPLAVKRIADFTHHYGYIYRFGGGALSNLTKWRAGDYSGYTIPDLPPLEKEMDLGSLSFKKYYPKLNNIGTIEDRRFVNPICKIFPASDSPFPYDLAQKPAYKNLTALYSQSVGIDKIGNGCFYEKVEATGVITDLPHSKDTPTSQICTGPARFQGMICVPSGESPDPSCSTKYGTVEVNNCQDIGKVTEYNGLEGMCLEFDTLNPLFEDLYKDIYKSCSGGSGCGSYLTKDICESDTSNNCTWSGPDYQPYACLSYFPFLIDTCALHSGDSVGCELNPNCELRTGGNCVVAK